MNIFGVGLPEIAVVVALALLVFGPKRLPDLGRTLGTTLKGVQSASSEFEKELQKAMTETQATAEEESNLKNVSPSQQVKKQDINADFQKKQEDSAV